MVATTVPRFSPALRIIGFTLGIPAILVLIGATIVLSLGIGAGGSSVTKAAIELRNQRANELREVRGMPEAVIDDFQADGEIERTTLVTLTAEQRDAVERAEQSYRIATIGATTAGGAVTAASGCGLVTLYFLLVPVLIVAFVLT